MQKATIVAVAGTSATTVISAAAGYFYAKKKLSGHYAEIAEQEIEEAREYYTKLEKRGDFETPQAAVKKLVPEDVEVVVEAPSEVKAKEAMARYQGQNVKVVRDPSEVSPQAEPAEEPEVVVETVEEKTTTRVLFEGQPLDPDAFDIEAERDLRRNGVPYVVSQEEYDENPDRNEQIVLTYFAFDDVLVDEEEKEIDDVERRVGKENLTRFGHGSNDPVIVYVRNEQLGLDFEILRSEGSYAEEVLGLDQTDVGNRDERMQRRRGLEE